MDKFGTYEIFAIIIPGLCFLIGGNYFVGTYIGYQPLVFQDISVGGLGIGIVVSYVVGQEIQLLGKWFEQIWWKCRIRPRERLQGRKLLFSEPVCQNILRNLQYIDIEISEPIDWSFVQKRIVAMLPEKQTGRLHTFNSQYGMFRGLVIVFTIFFVASFFLPYAWWQIGIACSISLFFLIGSILRMENFSQQYAMELYMSFLDSVKKEGKTIGKV